MDIYIERKCRYEYVRIRGLVYIHIFFLLCSLRGSGSNATLVAMSTASAQILVSIPFPNKRNYVELLREMADSGAGAGITT